MEKESPNYFDIRDAISLAMASSHLPMNGLGEVFVDGIGVMSQEEYWENVLDNKSRNQYKIQAQAALDVIVSIGMKHVMVQSLEKYVDEK